MTRFSSLTAALYTMLGCTLILILLVHGTFGSSEHILSTPVGNITGLHDELLGSPCYSFYGIPYAKPPVGDLRFLRPVPYGSVDDFNATQLGPSCYQAYGPAGVPFGQEDCLVLNIFTGLKMTDLKPVMLFIHGGGFVTGSAKEFPGPALVAMGDVVLVSINYRVGLFGFLPTDDYPLHPNAGLYDQRMAIEWTKDNIDAFGGNPNDITIFGHSAAGGNILEHMLSHKNNNTLFQKAIVQSNALNSYIANQPNPLISAEKLSDLMRCEGQKSQQVLNCLKGMTSKEVSDAYWQSGLQINWPLVGDYFEPGLREEIETLLENPTEFHDTSQLSKSLQLFGQYHMIAGITSQESLSILDPIYGLFNNISQGLSYDEVLNVMIAHMRFTDPLYNGKVAAATLSRWYVDNLREPDWDMRQTNLAAFVELHSDFTFGIPAVRMLQLHSLVRSNNINTFAYIYDVIASEGRPSVGGEEPPSWLVHGTRHGGEMPLVFGFPFLFNSTYSIIPLGEGMLSLTDTRNHSYTEEEKKLSSEMISYFTSFARTGFPVSRSSRSPWQQFYLHNSSYASIGLNETVMKSGMKRKQLSFWNSLWTAFTDVTINKTELCSAFKSDHLGGMANLTPDEASGVITTLIVILSLLGVVSLVLIIIAVQSKMKSTKTEKELKEHSAKENSSL